MPPALCISVYIWGSVGSREKEEPQHPFGVERSRGTGPLFQQSACLLPLYLVQVGKLRQGGTIERNQILGFQIECW